MFPVRLVDIGGSAVMIVLSFFCVRHALWLHRKEPQDLIWTYLLWFSCGLFAFSLSRSGGHLIRYFLMALHQEEVWISIRPVSGSLNTLSFVLVGAITLFSSRVYVAYQQMQRDKALIEGAHAEIIQLNTNLERMVEARTRDLSASERKYRRVFEGSRDMLFICEADGRILDINQSGVVILGLSRREEALDRNLFQDFFHEEDVETIQREIRDRDFLKDLEVTLRREDGEIILGLLSLTVRRENNRRPHRLEGTVKDMTGRRIMERQLLQADKLASLGQLSAGIAHEINNPLGLIFGYAQLLLKASTPGTQLHEDLKIIEKHAINCKKIVEDLLKFSRTSGTAKIEAQVNELIRDVVSVVRSKFQLDHVSVVEQLDPNLPATTVDPDKMKQVFVNLLMNARQAIEGRGSIEISTGLSSDGSRLLISFSDTGGGIPGEILPKIFDPFFTTKPTGMGTGLGLSVSYGIVRDHEGEILVESTPGKGSVFTVSLPLKSGSAGSAQTSSLPHGSNDV
jgi:PAS domain S-box-containing protein